MSQRHFRTTRNNLAKNLFLVRTLGSHLIKGEEDLLAAFEKASRIEIVIDGQIVGLIEVEEGC